MTGAPAPSALAVFPLGPDFAGRRYAVLGLARSGLATVRALLAAGAEVYAWDEDEERRNLLTRTPHPNPSPRGEGLGLADPLSLNLSGFAGVVVSPGVPLNRHPIAAHAARFAVPVIGDIELFAEARRHLPPHKVVGITGTNGKSTTTALIHHILRTAGVPSLMGGNIGLPILATTPLPEGGIYVLELSSYQIDLTFSLDCDVAVLLNVTPDHLDRYESFAAYRAAKLRLFEMQSATSVAVDMRREASGTPGQARGDEQSRPSPVTPAEEPGPRFAQSDWPALQGPHNAENAAAAISVCVKLGVEADAIEAGLRSYPGLPHRMERIATVNGVLYVNDSKATNPEAAAPALAAYTNIHWILGGLAKGATLGDCAQHFGHVARAYLIGTAAADFARAIGDAIPTEYSGDLASALASAAAHARPGDVVLLSPAAASFDQFRDFEARGDAFRAWVESFAGGQS